LFYLIFIYIITIAYVVKKLMILIYYICNKNTYAIIILKK
jgi:hypothetical protein